MGGGETPPRRAGPEMGGGVALPLPPLRPVRRARPGRTPVAPGPGGPRAPGPHAAGRRYICRGPAQRATPPLPSCMTVPAFLALPCQCASASAITMTQSGDGSEVPSPSAFLVSERHSGTDEARGRRRRAGPGRTPVAPRQRAASACGARRRAPHATRRESQSTEEAVPILESRMRRCRATHHPPRGRRRQERMRAPFRVETPACPPPACMPCPRAPDVRRGGSDRHQRVPSSASHKRRVLRQPSAQGRRRRSWT